jgi:ABC-type phosphate transport system substrate-binding protein
MLLPSRRRALSFLVTALALGTSGAHAGEPANDFKVIVHAARPETQLARGFLADAFLKNLTRWRDDETIRPVDQRSGAAVRRRFSEVVLKRSVSAVKTYWQQRIFSGRGVPPPELDSDDAVVRWVEEHPGAVGYITGSASPGRTKVIAVIP